MPKPAPRSLRRIATLLRHDAGSVLIEAAFAIPILITLLLGMVIYGNWFMTAHSLQQAANDAARAAVAGLDSAERLALVNQSVNASRPAFPSPSAQAIVVDTDYRDDFYRVTLSYNLANTPIFSASPFPITAPLLERSAIVRIAPQ
ncbi:TadE/TadG family type IV pilus assembly protein [Sphingobium sp.]|uniref:TadE/TadG family type IV pilus assembly protein n=1 Tax=Sphingobium sp. TaxID=1912891 RepID=UPI003BB7F0FB